MVHAFKTTIITTWTKLGHPTFPQTKSKSTGNSHSIVFINITFTKYMGSGTWKYIWGLVLENTKAVNLCKNLRDWLKYENLRLAPAECAKSMLQILLLFD